MKELTDESVKGVMAQLKEMRNEKPIINMGKFSNCKWHAVQYAGFYAIQDKPYYSDCTNLFDAEYVGIDQAKANAELAAEAPVLLAKVKLLQSRLEMLISMTPTGERRNGLTLENIQTMELINKFI